MTAYIIRRLLMLPIILFGVTILIFAMLQVLGPVERSALYIRDFPKNEGALEAIIKRYGLDDPFLFSIGIGWWAAPTRRREKRWEVCCAAIWASRAPVESR